MKGLSKDSATWHEVGEAGEAQRVDNYLMRLLKGIPKSHIYRILRTGQVRVNSARVNAEHRLKPGDRLRLPPLRAGAQPARVPETLQAAPPRFEGRILHEDEWLLVIDKPAGMAVHGGSGVSVGVIEQLRRERPAARFLELAHRLDRDTSGVLLLAKKRTALADLHAQLREGRVHKFYLALATGRWRAPKQVIREPLHKYVLPSGERRVRVEREGQAAHTIIRLKRAGVDFSLLEVELKTGRTHQIRVHLAHAGHPIAGDDKYGDFELNKGLVRRGLKRMFLHACKLTLTHPGTGKPVTFEAPLPEALARLAQALLDSYAETV